MSRGIAFAMRGATIVVAVASRVPAPVVPATAEGGGAAGLVAGGRAEPGLVGAALPAAAAVDRLRADADGVRGFTAAGVAFRDVFALVAVPPCLAAAGMRGAACAGVAARGLAAGFAGLVAVDRLVLPAAGVLGATARFAGAALGFSLVFAAVVLRDAGVALAGGLARPVAVVLPTVFASFLSPCAAVDCGCVARAGFAFTGARPRTLVAAFFGGLAGVGLRVFFAISLSPVHGPWRPGVITDIPPRDNLAAGCIGAIEREAWDQVNPLTRLILWLLSLYKRLLSPLFGPRCRYHPSCSDYARIAVARFGPWRGLLLALWRLSRCQPLCPGGNDPVPETFRFPRWRGGSNGPGGE